MENRKARLRRRILLSVIVCILVLGICGCGRNFSPYQNAKMQVYNIQKDYADGNKLTFENAPMWAYTFVKVYFWRVLILEVIMGFTLFRIVKKDLKQSRKVILSFTMITIIWIALRYLIPALVRTL